MRFHIHHYHHHCEEEEELIMVNAALSEQLSDIISVLSSKDETIASLSAALDGAAGSDSTAVSSAISTAVDAEDTAIAESISTIISAG